MLRYRYLSKIYKCHEYTFNTRNSRSFAEDFIQFTSINTPETLKYDTLVKLDPKLKKNGVKKDGLVVTMLYEFDPENVFIVQDFKEYLKFLQGLCLSLLF